jgi:hypothetical protein
MKIVSVNNYDANTFCLLTSGDCVYQPLQSVTVLLF